MDEFYMYEEIGKRQFWAAYADSLNEKNKWIKIQSC